MVAVVPKARKLHHRWAPMHHGIVPSEARLTDRRPIIHRGSRSNTAKLPHDRLYYIYNNLAHTFGSFA